MIIAAFSGVGKTIFCNWVEDAKDFVCMPYKYSFAPGWVEMLIFLCYNKLSYL